MKNILFNVEMTKAILDGRKVQTRRVIKTMPIMSEIGLKKDMMNYLLAKSKYQTGETIWVREPAKVDNYDIQMDRSSIELKYEYLADGTLDILEDIPERFIEFGDPSTLPRWIYKKQGIPNGCIKEMARIFLKITNVRVERLQDISWNDCRKEGVTEIIPSKRLKQIEDDEQCINVKDRWIELWNKTAPKGYKWEDNPYVFVYEFERVSSDGSKM